MLPNLVYPQMQPHHYLDHFNFSNNPPLPYRSGKTVFPSSFSLDGLPEDLIQQSVPRHRVQFPHPVQRIDSRDAVDLRPLPKNTGEHVLKRKTPSGTLAAGYDGSPVDATVQPPATKHILVSPLESSQSFVSPQSGIPLSSWSHPTVDRHPSSAKSISFAPVFNDDLARKNNVFPSRDTMSEPAPRGWVHSSNYLGGGVDPHQVPPPFLQQQQQPPHQRIFLPNVTYVPTVLPGTLQPGMGPTASAGSGPYGPYWPDGAYIPYRPAALRDSHNGHHLPPRVNAMYGIPPPQPPPGRVSVPDPTFLWNQAPAGGGLVDNQEHVLTDSLPPHQRSFFDPSQNHQQALPYHTRHAKPPPASYPTSSHPLAMSGGNPARPGITLRTENAEFKEKILAWAHGVYVDLLASIHQARRNSFASGIADGQAAARLLRPSIYPKPPRQPGLDFSSPNNNQDVSRYNTYPNSQYDQQAQKGVSVSTGMYRYGPRPDFAPHRVSEMPVVERLGGMGRLPGSNSIPSGFSNYGNDNSMTAVNAASAALEMLSHLCAESGWEWIDGLLLGGCLAYGLGDYHKAMRWYSRILARDET